MDTRITQTNKGSRHGLHHLPLQDQYKGYGKAIRKMIADCLQKDPTKRPTASELLKHPFFKRAKDKKYLQSVLLQGGPSIEERVSKVRSSCRVGVVGVVVKEDEVNSLTP